MKKKKFVALLMAFTAAFVLGLTACDGCDDDDKPDTPIGGEDNTGGDNNGGENNGENNDPPVVNPPVVDTVNVGITQESVTVKDYEVADFNFARYFRITDDNAGVSAKDYVDASAVKAEEGEYEVTCTYKEKTAKLKVIVEASECVVTLSREEISMNTAAMKEYDFKALFTATIDGKSVVISDSMVATDLKEEAGDYEYTVTCGSASKTLKITIIDEYAIEILKSYPEYEMTLSEIEDFDFTQLFSIFVGGVAEEVKKEYIDVTSLQGAEEGNSYNVTLNFEKNDRQASSTVKIKVVAQTQISINGKTVITYPNGENIDLKSLFEVKRGSQVLTVTDDMISGAVDYSKEGDNVITLNYGGRLAYATVKVQLGVIIGYASSDTVLVQKGTPVSEYDFGADFDVVINGIRFTNFDISYFDLTGVDFDVAGEYKVKIKIPYNSKPLGIGVVDFDYFEKEITYEVVEKKVDFTIDVLQESVLLPSGTTKYNVFNNLNVVIDGVKRTPYDRLDWLGATTCYAEIKSEALDFASPAEQYVEIDVFVYGPELEPVTVGFTVRIDNGVEVKGSERVIFSGTSVYPKDLFEITEKGEPVEVTNDLVTGKIDLFNSGIYFVTATYKGMSAQSKVVVLDEGMTGTYKTLLTTIEPAEEDDDDYEYGWGDYDGDFDAEGYSLSAPYAASSYAAVSLLQDVVIDEEGNIFVGDIKAEITSIVDDSTFNISVRTYNYVMHYADGILTFDPLNEHKLAYNEYSRPMVFFNESKWTVENYVQINSSINGYNVLQRNGQGNLLVSGGAYTLDLIQLSEKESGEKCWYGMKTHFLTKNSSDTYYADEVFDFATFAPDFEQKTGAVSSVVLGGERYEFTMSDKTKGIINKAAQTVSPFAGMNFKGTIDGKDAAFSVNGSDRVTLKIDGKTIFDITQNDQNSLKNAGIDYNENTWLLYNGYYDKENTPVSYRLRLDTESKTFTVDEKDDLFGRYSYDKYCFFFDGYGTGEVWFDTSSKYMTTAFTYVRNGNNVEITYRNPEPSFAYGKTAKFLFADYKNVLTLREITNADALIGKNFVNELIDDGAIVEVNNFVLGKASAKTELLNGLSIITKDGALSYNDKEKGKIAGTNVPYVDFSKIQFAIPGFYQLIVNIPVNGEVKSAYYSVQILDNIYSGNKLVGRYTAGVINSGASISLDEYGRASGIFAGVSFEGTASLKEQTFTATAKCGSGTLTITGELISNGIVKVTSRGAVMFTDYFTTGTSKVCGTEDYTFRAITVGETSVYVLANAVTSVGNVVEIEALTGDIATLGSILKITDANRELVVKITEWGSTGKGLVLSDSVRGTYAKADADDLTLDGFGSVTLGAKNGTYTNYGNGVTALFGDEMKIYEVSSTDKTYKESSKAIDVTLLAGKSFEATYTFDCDYGSFGEDGNGTYRAVTTFEFLENGKVVVKSTSSEHDEECGDKYNPEYATNEGIEGTFTVVGNKITVTVNGKTIEFTFTDAVGLGTITCSKTGVSSGSHGYFAVGTDFTLL